MPKLTRRMIDETVATERDIILRDEGTGAVPGLHARIRKGGSKTYFLYYRTTLHKERRIKIARCEEMVPERAREIARDMIEIVRKGGDPAADREKARNATKPVTYREAVEDYVAREQEGRKGNATAHEVRRTLLREGKAWQDKALAEVSATDIRNLLEAMRDGTKARRPRPYLANRTFAYLRTFFDWCAAPGIEILQASPMLGLKRPWDGEKPRDRVFSDGELRALWQAADAFPDDMTMATGPQAGAFLKVMLLTGKRRGMLAAMQWAELDEEGNWKPTAARRRNKRLHTTPLPALARAIIQAVPKKEGNPYVFAGRKRGRPLDPGTPLAKDIREHSGVADFFFHACRHTLETRLAALRVPPHLRDMLLDHAPARGSGAGYDHHDYLDEMREALEQWASLLSSIVA